MLDPHRDVDIALRDVRPDMLRELLDNRLGTAVLREPRDERGAE